MLASWVWTAFLPIMAGAIAQQPTSRPLGTSAIFQMGLDLTEASWLKSGPEVLRGLKARATKSQVFKSAVSAQCPQGGDCVFNKEVLLFCESLMLAAGKGYFGEHKMLENIAFSTVHSTQFYGLDLVGQSAMIARWGRDDQWAPQLPASNLRIAADSLVGMKGRLVSDIHFRSAVEQVCSEMESVRPKCRERATEGLFCQALGQAAGVSLPGTDVQKALDQIVREHN